MERVEGVAETAIKKKRGGSSVYVYAYLNGLISIGTYIFELFFYLSNCSHIFISAMLVTDF